ncbi:MAG: isopentenyl phosphate kinase [Thermoflexales bacterium]|nr:isopentenyl phosphate kinase [Thermoflexales bacterium]MDW8293443.1 isopentenyl phosphate kinase [Anaerolineae bacterium]
MERVITLLKLGGSLITEKTQASTPRLGLLRELAEAIAQAWREAPLPLVIGHGSGSFGHATAQRYGTRAGVHTPEQWRGFAEVSVVAARLNRLVVDALHDAGLPVVAFPPSASARCHDGRLVALATEPIREALLRGLVPVVMGDVAFDVVRGGTIVSTEEVFAYLAAHLPVARVLLAGETEGVYRAPDRPEVLPVITPADWSTIQHGVGEARGADVTGGMAAKVRAMLDLVQAHPTLIVRIFGGLKATQVAAALRGEPVGTLIAATDDARLVPPAAPLYV